MDDPLVLVLLGSALIGLLATIVVLRRQRREAEDATRESPFAASTEGAKLCPRCGMGNLWTERRCSNCGAQLRG